MNIKFSVVIPVYGVENYLEKCVNSVLNQTYKNFELILVDDGSKDNCPAICDKFSQIDNRVRVIHKQNEGVVIARQQGVNISTGDYIILIDGDDYVDINYLQEFFNVINKYECDIVCDGMVIESPTKQEKKTPEYKLGFYDKNKIVKEIYPSLIEDKYGKYFPPSLWAKAFKRELYLANHLLVDSKIKIGEDNTLTKSCIYNANSLYVMDSCLYYYVQRENSATGNKRVFLWNYPKAIGNHFEKYLCEGYDFSPQINRLVVHYLFNVTLSQFNLDKSYKEIKKIIIDNLNDDYYKKAIKNCKYSIKYFKGFFAKIILKYKLIKVAKFLHNKQK